MIIIVIIMIVRYLQTKCVILGNTLLMQKLEANLVVTVTDVAEFVRQACLSVAVPPGCSGGKYL